MRFERENRDLFKAFGSVLHAKGIKIDYISDIEGVDPYPFVGVGFGHGQMVFYVRPKNGKKFSYSVEYIKAQFTIINIDGYQFAYEDFLSYECNGDIFTPDMLLFTVWKDGENVLKGEEF